MPFRKIAIFLFAIAYLSLFTTSAKAQTDTPRNESVLGEVRGSLFNKSPNGIVSEKIELMLHVWDQYSVGQGMYHGESLPDGSFIFSDIELNPALIYAVMANHDGAAYFSEIKTPAQEDTFLEFEVPIYDTTGHLSQVTIDQAHVLFNFEQGSLEIMEIYLLSNLGEYTVKNAVTLDNGQLATIAFSLPENSTSISFQNNDDSRFIQYLDGFADTSPLIPGIDSGQIVVRYITSYKDSFSYTFLPPLMVKNVEFLVAQDDGITIETGSKNLSYAGSKSIQDNATYEVYSYSSLQAGESLELIISGEPTNISVPVIGTGEIKEPTKVTSNLEIGLGALILGLVLISASAWWWRKLQTIDEDELDSLLDQPDYRELVAQIVDLDESFQTEKISKEDFQKQHEALILHGKALLMKEK